MLRRCKSLLSMLSLLVVVTMAHGFPVQTNTWTVSPTGPNVITHNIPQGESQVFNFTFSPTNNMTGMTCVYFYRHSTMTNWWSITGSVSNATATIPWGNSNDAGYSKYEGWIRVLSDDYPTYKIKLKLSMISTPGFVPNTTLLTNATAVIDWSDYASYTNTSTHGPVRGGAGIGVVTNLDGSLTFSVSGAGSGDVVGPSSATADDIVLFDGTTGKLIKDSGAKLSDYLTTTGDGSGLSGVVTSESDPIVGAVTGLIKADGGGNISAAVENTDYQGVLAEGAFVDGDKTKLDGIEVLADVTDETNVTAAGAGMTNAYNTWATSNLWEGDMYFDGAGYFDIDAAGNRLFIKDVEGVDVMAWSDGSRRLYDGAGNQLIVMAEAAAPVLNYVASNGMWKVNGTATNGDQIVNYSTATNLIATLAPASSLADVLAVGNDANSLAITNLASIEIDGDSITGVITNGVLELDGSEAMTGDLNMGGNLITNASDGSYTGTLATTTLVADYLPLAGGTLTGQLTAETNIVLASGSRIYIGTNMYLTTTSTSTNWTFGRLDSTNTVICPIP